MTKPSVIAAQLVDVRNVGMHKCIKLTLHVPAEQASEVMAAFGWPTAVEPVSVALARLDPDTATKPRKSVASDKRLAQRAGMLCADPVFAKFMVEEGKARSADGEEIAASVRRYCGVASRSEIIPGTPAAERWDKLSSRFSVWLTAPELAG